MLELVFIQGSDRGKVVPLQFDEASFGDRFDVVRRGIHYVLIDRQSATEVTLSAGDRVGAGEHVILVREIPEAQSAYRFVAEWRGGDGNVQVFQGDSVLLGRRNICQIHLNHPAVDAVHAELDRRPDGVWIVDRSAGAGVYVNGQRAIERQLKDGDSLRIGPFEIGIQLQADMCWISVEQSREVAQTPEIWVPTSDVSSSRFRSRALLVTLLAVLEFAGFAARRPTFFSLGSLSKVHDGKGCGSCHVGFHGVSQEACQKCHSDVAPARPEHSGVSCTGCHSEHQGLAFDIERNVGKGCQAGGCHVTVHRSLEGAILPKVSRKIPTAVAFEAKFEDFDKNPHDPIHLKHVAAMKGECVGCHTNGDPKIRVGRAPMRMRCLGCHGFGPEATLRDRCYSCHFEHRTATQDVLSGKLKF